MKKTYVYRRGKVVEKGSSGDWEEEPLVRINREYEKLSPREIVRYERMVDRAVDRYRERRERQQENLELIQIVYNFLSH